jgi:hypothetical protein
MTDARTGTGVPKPAKTRTVSHFMKVPVAAELLRTEHGDENARRIALQEQQKARRARSRKRFEFWGEVATLIGQRSAENGRAIPIVTQGNFDDSSLLS